MTTKIQINLTVKEEYHGEIYDEYKNSYLHIYFDNYDFIFELYNSGIDKQKASKMTVKEWITWFANEGYKHGMTADINSYFSKTGSNVKLTEDLLNKFKATTLRSTIARYLGYIEELDIEFIEKDGEPFQFWVNAMADNDDKVDCLLSGKAAKFTKAMKETFYPSCDQFTILKLMDALQPEPYKQRKDANIAKYRKISARNSDIIAAIVTIMNYGNYARFLELFYEYLPKLIEIWTIRARYNIPRSTELAKLVQALRATDTRMYLSYFPHLGDIEEIKVKYFSNNMGHLCGIAHIARDNVRLLSDSTFRLPLPEERRWLNYVYGGLDMRGKGRGVCPAQLKRMKFWQII